MNQEITKELIEKYLAGADLPTEDLTRIEEALRAENDNLRNEIITLASAPTWSEPLLQGIRFAGQQALKKKLSTVSDALKTEGFFLDEEDIQAWHRGELAEDKIAVLQKRLSEDADFAQKVAAEKSLLNGIQQHGKQQLKDKIESVRKSLEIEGFFEEKQVRGDAKIVQMRARRWWLAAAAAIAILAVAAIWRYFQQPPEPEILYAQYFKPYPDNISESLRSELATSGYAGSPEETKWKAFLAAMETYPNSVPALESFLEKYPAEKIACFYLAQAQMANDNLEAAKANFEVLENDAGFEEHWAVKWHLALIFLKQNDLSRTRQLLEELKQAPDFQEKAGDLLKKLS